MKQVTAYRCDHCSKTSSKSAISRHEKMCKRNPNNKHVCYECIHLDVHKEERRVVEYGCGVTRYVKVFTCLKTGNQMYSYKAEKNQLKREIAGKVRMPLECPMFTNEWR